MKTTALTLSALAVLAGLAGCSKESLGSSSSSSSTTDQRTDGSTVKVTLSAVQESGGTRAAIGETSDSKTAVLWSDGDKLSVFDGENANKEFKLTDGSGKTSGTFGGEVGKTSESYVALHPYQADASINTDRNVISKVSLKSSQSAIVSSFDPEAALMVAKETTEGKLEFKNVVGYVKVTPKFDCKKITLVSNSSSDALAGTVSISLASDDGTPTAKAVSDASNSVSIEGDIKANTTYYIAVLPAKLASGFKLMFTDSKGNDSYRESSKTLEIKRNTITDLGSIEKSNLTDIPYITFSADVKGKFKMTLTNSTTYNNSFQYSVGGAEWEIVKSGTWVEFGGEGNDLRLRGESNVGTATSKTSYCKIAFDTMSSNSSNSVSCTGDIRTLIDWKNYKTVSTSNAKFCSLFSGNKYLSSVPDLPSTDIAVNCYHSMFKGCTNLTSIPDNLLPATTLKGYCYQNMFYGCTGLTSIPGGLLPAESLENATSCYSEMFNGCTSLTSIPNNLLPAKTLVGSCYSTMFQGCTNLTDIPENLLPATTLVSNCYYKMFAGCKELVSVPKTLLPAELLKDDCYKGMFQSCEKLETAPDLPATSLAERCYQEMFYGCKALTSIPGLPAEKLAENCYNAMFKGCSSLTEVGSNLLKAKTLAKGCYHEMFSECTSLKKVPSDLLPVTDLKESCYNSMFMNCTALESAPELPAPCLVTTCYQSMFEKCTSLTSVNLGATYALEQKDGSLDNWLSGTVPDPADGKTRTLKTYLDLTEGTDYPTGWTVSKLTGTE